MRRNRTIPLLFYGLISLLCIDHIALGDSKISDAQKKETVYRMYAGYEKDFPGIKDISPQQAMELMDQGAVVFIDTRKPAEMAVSMIPNALTRAEFLKHLFKYKEKIYDSDGKTRRIHVYDKRWNYLPDGYKPVMFGFFEKYF